MEEIADNLEEGNHTLEITVLEGGLDKQNIIFKERIAALLEQDSVAYVVAAQL